MNFCLRSISRSVIIFVFLYAGTIYAVDCNCGDFCGSCGSNTPKYLLAVLTNLKGCPADFHQGASQVYPCFDGKTMDVVLKQDTINQCGYCWYGPAFTVEDCPFQFRLGFYINLSAPDNETTFSVILQEDCGGWYDLSWLTTSASSSCKITGSASYSSYCAGPFPGIESGIVSWAPLVLSDGNCAGCGDVNEIPENCGQLSCATLDEYSKISGSSAQYYGPFMIYSPSKCQTHAKSGNAIQTAKIVCPDAQLVSATASSSSPADIIVVPQNISCSPGNSAGFAIYALRGKGIVTLNAKFYQKAFSDQCIVKETIKTVTILVQPDPGDECCTDQYKPVLLEGSPGNVSTPIRAGTNPLDEWPEAAIYRSGDFEDVEVIIPGRFTPVIFNNGKAPEYMRGWKSRISESNAVVITNPESIKYIYEPNTNYRIHTVQNSLGRNIVEFIYDGNGLPLRQNDLIDANLYISYHYTGDVLTEIREHSGGYCRPYPLEYDNEKISFVSGQCSNCSPNGGRRYFYNTGGTLKYEKSISDEILFEYEFDSQQRLTGKWAGDRQLNHPVQIVTYYDDPNGYTADLKEYADDTNFCSIREYYNNAGMLIRRTTCEVLNENIDSPAGRTFTQENIYDINELTGKLQKFTMKNPRAKSAITEMIFDPNCGELLRQVIYDSNLNPKIQIENYYEYIDSNGLVTDHPNQIFLARLIQSLDVYGASASYEYDDASCYPTQIIFEDGLVQQFEYDSEKKVLTHEFLDGNSTLQKRLTYDYDDFGNLISQTEYDGKDVNDTTEHIYNKFGEVIRTISADGVVAGKTYDDFGRIISEYTLADANDVAIDQPDLLCQENFAYDSNGLLVSHSKAIDTGVFTYNCPDERIYTNYQYDEYGRLAVIIEDVNKSALTTFYDYDRQNAIVRILHQGGKWIEFYYDGRGLLIEQIEGFGSSGINLTEYQYDENRNLTRQIDSDGTISDLQYDCFDRIQNHILPNKSYVNYQYNPSGQVICQTQYDINNNPLQQTVFEYDNFGRCRAMRQRETCGINSDTNDFVILYEYDFLDNLVRKTIKADNENNAISIDYHFDGKKRITEIIDGLSNIQRFSYDKDDNITAFTNTLNLPVNYIYDAFGRLIKTQMPDGSSKSFVYDSLKRCVKETLFDFNSTAVEQVRYEFDNKGNLNKKIVMLDPSSQAPADTLTDYITFITTTAKQGFVNRQ